MTTQQPLLLELFEFLDGLCIGHPMADKKCYELAKRCWIAAHSDESADTCGDCGVGAGEHADDCPRLA